MGPGWALNNYKTHAMPKLKENYQIKMSKWIKIKWVKCWKAIIEVERYKTNPKQDLGRRLAIMNGWNFEKPHVINDLIV